MAIQWPSSLSTDCFLDSYQETPGETTVRSSVDQGPPRVRQRASVAVDELVFELPLDSRAEVQALLDFHRVTLKGGSLAFERPHPRTGATITCRFKKAPAPRAESPTTWRGRLELEVLP